MNIIFLEDFNKFKTGEILNISKGFARNYLIPNFLAIFINKKIIKKKWLFFLKKIIILNDLKKKLFLKKIYYNFNNKNIYINNIYFILNKFFIYKNFILKKLGFCYYNYFIIFFKNIKNNKYILKIKLYNNIFINIFIFFL